MNRRSWILAGLTSLVLGLAYGPLLLEFFANQWTRPHYQYFPFVLGAFACLLWQRCGQAEAKIGVVCQVLGIGDGTKSQGERESRLAANWYDVVVSSIVAWALLALAYVLNSPWLAYLSAICLVTSCFLRIARRWYVPYLWGIWLLLWLVLPLPINRDQQLISSLQQLSSRLSSFLLDWVGIPHLMEGNTLLLSDKQFFVDEACSGIVSVLSIIACAVIYGVWRNRPPVHLAALAFTGIGWATLMNVVRISAIAIVYYWYGIDWSKGTQHEALGLVIFLCTFLALVSSDYAVVFFIAPVKAPDGQWYCDPPRFGRWLVDAWDWLVSSEAIGYSLSSGEEQKSTASMQPPTFSILNPIPDTYPLPTPGTRHLTPISAAIVMDVVSLVAFGTLSSAQLMIDHTPQWRSRSPHNLQRALALDATSLPRLCATLNRTSFEPVERKRDDIFGNYSRTYEYRDDKGNTYLVSCDFPFEPVGHELTVCYQGNGWHMQGREVLTATVKSEDGDTEWGYTQADFGKPDGSGAYLVFCAFDEYGARLMPPTYRLWENVLWSLRRQSYNKRAERTYQVQVWTTAAGEISPQQKQTARDVLLDVRERFRAYVTSSEG